MLRQFLSLAVGVLAALFFIHSAALITVEIVMKLIEIDAPFIFYVFGVIISIVAGVIVTGLLLLGSFIVIALIFAVGVLFYKISMLLLSFLFRWSPEPLDGLPASYSEELFEMNPERPLEV